MHRYEIYFDLKCVLCHADAKWLIQQDFSREFKIINFRTGEVGSTQISPQELEKQLHLVDLETGEVYRGIQSVIFILSLSNNWAWAAYLLKLPFIYPLAWCIYRSFALVRRIMPKRRTCEL